MKYSEVSKGVYLIGESNDIVLIENGRTDGPIIDAPLGGYKITVGVDVRKKASIGVLQVLVALSFDGKNFSEPVETGMEVDTSIEGIHVGSADLSDLRSPFYRLSLAKSADADAPEAEDRNEPEEVKPYTELNAEKVVEIISDMEYEDALAYAGEDERKTVQAKLKELKESSKEKGSKKASVRFIYAAPTGEGRR